MWWRDSYFSDEHSSRGGNHSLRKKKGQTKGKINGNQRFRTAEGYLTNQSKASGRKKRDLLTQQKGEVDSSSARQVKQGATREGNNSYIEAIARSDPQTLASYKRGTGVGRKLAADRL